MRTARQPWWTWPALAVAAVGVAGALAVRAGTGEVDPGGLAVGLFGLMLTMVGMHQANRPHLPQDIDTAGLTKLLADHIRKREREARQSLLGGSDRTIDVEFTLLPSPAHHATGAELQGTLEEAAAYYRDLQPGRLVITGAPGAGKTVLALHLMLRLLAAREPGDPVPVRLSLSTFDPSRNTLEDWLAEHLTRTYRLHPTEAVALVTGRLVIPVLDGLDEMDVDGTPEYGSRAAAALAAMNTYGDGDGTAKGRLVLTCRSTRYAQLEAEGLWAQDAARIDIDPVSLAGTMAFITARACNPARWDPVLNVLRAAPTGPLALGLSTPWRLTIALAVYDERRLDNGRWVRDPADLLAATLQTPEQIRDHLLNLFISAASSADGTTGPYTQLQVRTWLTVLARYLHANNTISAGEVAGRRLSGTDLVLHELWPLTGRRRARTVHVLLVIAVWATADLPAALLDSWNVYATNVALMVVASLLIGIPPWPVPSRLERVSRTPAGRRQFVNGLVGGVLWGVFAVVVDMGNVVGPAIGIAYGLVVGLVGGAMVGFGLAGVLSDVPEVRRSYGNASPRGMVRDDLVTGFAIGLVVGLLFVPFYWFALGPALAPGAVPIYMLLFGLGGGRVLALLYHRLFREGYRSTLDSLFRPWRAFGPLLRTGAGPALGAAGVRYMAFLLCTRPWWSDQPLPWRLGRFLDWCCHVGLTRTAGIAYQFRHRELQDFLTRCHPHHDPPNPMGSPSNQS
ncbi:NACHT domain-containing protein [Streptomyces sp. NPDC088124]|uniref:NACHT domain-containing protein n=1 Tax=Streptomyces sp. NPDC088124 TaxID=3154654 RepID=UPI0034346206